RVATTRKGEIVAADLIGATGTAGPVCLPGGVPVNTLLSVPLCARGRTLGVLSLGLGPSGRSFDADALPIATDLANRAAIALDNALLYKNIQDEDRRKNEFLAMLAHELRNPLAPISNAVHVMQACENDPAKVAWGREVIARQTRQLVRLVDDLLDVSRITRGKIELKIETLDVAEVVSSAVETSRPNVDAHEHTLTIMLPPEPLSMTGDFARVAQALANLVNNAAKYTERGGRIAITVTQEGPEIVFRVRDSGVGIPPEHLGTIFEPFTQVERSLDRSQGGLGIGLTLVRRLIEMQGGSVSAYSAGKDQGSEFTIRLPAVKTASTNTDAGSRPEVPQRASTGGLSVLVVDDNHDVAESTAMVLRMAGCDVHVAHDGAAALMSMARLRPDAVLLDIGLPGMDGYEVASRIRSDPAYRRTLVVAVSGYGQDEYRIRSSQAGFDYHVVKPISPGMLTGLLGSLRGHRPPPSAENVVSFPARRAIDGA
ncbi:MAG TPA: ATP-binding protein, partial [Casimicrobiaceae bacterium]|nr:ATP-binding protein [Casimicrobiaceae bacterium]